MRVFAVLLIGAMVACRAPRDIAAPPVAATSPCVMSAEDSLWLEDAVGAWQRTRQRALQLASEPMPLMILFDLRCAHRIVWRDPRSVTASPHGGVIKLPNGRSIPRTGVGVTSPTLDDTAIFLALALPDVWRADPRYRDMRDTRRSWERYLTGAFIHEMTHARMLPQYLPRLRALEAAVYPDTMEDNAVQNRFGKDTRFAESVSRETDLLYRAVSATNRRVRMELVAAALARIRERRARYYVGDFAAWSELEQTFLDIEGVAQWAAFMNARGPTQREDTFERALARFRAGTEFWSEDQGLGLILALDALVPGWQARVFAREPTTSLDLLAEAIGAQS